VPRPRRQTPPRRAVAADMQTGGMGHDMPMKRPLLTSMDRFGANAGPTRAAAARCGTTPQRGSQVVSHLPRAVTNIHGRLNDGNGSSDALFRAGEIRN
jgi:hypothetical protein